MIVDARIRAQLIARASHAGQDGPAFVEALLSRIAAADVKFDDGIPAFPRRRGAPALKVEDVESVARGGGP